MRHHNLPKQSLAASTIQELRPRPIWPSKQLLFYPMLRLRGLLLRMVCASLCPEAKGTCGTLSCTASKQGRLMHEEWTGQQNSHNFLTNMVNQASMVELRRLAKSQDICSRQNRHREQITWTIGVGHWLVVDPCKRRPHKPTNGYAKGTRDTKGRYQWMTQPALGVCFTDNYNC